MTAYKKLVALFTTYQILQDTGMDLLWDMNVMMPPGGVASRSRQMAELDALAQQQLKRAPALLEQARLENLDSPSDDANLREMQRKATLEASLDPRLMSELNEATSTCQAAWEVARKEDDFSLVATKLQRVIDLTRQKARLMGDATGQSPYAALVSYYQPGVSEDQIDKIFATLGRELPRLRQAATERSESLPPVLPLFEGIQNPTIMRICTRVAADMGLDFTRSRLDIGPHPMTTGHSGDVRITTFHNRGPLVALLADIHEVGHALYELALPQGEVGLQPVSRNRGIGIHESQSMIMEVIMARGPAFATYLSSLLCDFDEFGLSGPAYTAENIMRNFQQMNAGPNVLRLTADPLNYQAHVALRVDLERRLIQGSLKAKDLPEAWRCAAIRMLGYAPTSDAYGVLQDIHWFMGLVGYFPCYVLGAIGAAQMWEQLSQEAVDNIYVGNFTGVNAWLTEHVRRHGSFCLTDELLTRATGRTWDPHALLYHFEARYVRGEG